MGDGERGREGEIDGEREREGERDGEREREKKKIKREKKSDRSKFGT